MNSGLVILGILILAGMLIFSNVLITPQQKSQIKVGSSLCGSPLGTIGGALSSDVAKGCEQASFLGTILQFEPFIYLAGIGLFVVGLAIPSSKKEIHIIREAKKSSHKEDENIEEVEDEETEEEIKEETEEKSSKGYKFCSKCGTKVSKKSKFCSKCGEKI